MSGRAHLAAIIPWLTKNLSMFTASWDQKWEGLLSLVMNCIACLEDLGSMEWAASKHDGFSTPGGKAITPEDHLILQHLAGRRDFNTESERNFIQRDKHIIQSSGRARRSRALGGNERAKLS